MTMSTCPAHRPPLVRGAHLAPPAAHVTIEGARRTRVAHLDKLKVLLVAVIVAAHGAAVYSDLESAWPCQDVQEVRLGPVINDMPGLPAVLFVMGLFVLISGLVTPGAVARKGPRTFARDRLVRLGLAAVAPAASDRGGSGRRLESRRSAVLANAGRDRRRGLDRDRAAAGFKRRSRP